MGKLIVHNMVTLDGVMQSPSGLDEDPRGGFAQGGWARPYASATQGDEVAKGMASTRALLFGRRTYENMFSFWPKQTDGNPFTEVLNNQQKFVVSQTLAEPLEWQNSTLLSGDVPAAVAKAKDDTDGDIVILGSGELIQSLLPAGLIDEFILLIHPIVVGNGRRLFAAGAPHRTYTLVAATPTETGVIIATYRQSGDGRPTAAQLPRHRRSARSGEVDHGAAANGARNAK